MFRSPLAAPWPLRVRFVIEAVGVVFASIVIARAAWWLHQDRRYDTTKPAVCWIGHDIQVDEVAPGRFRGWTYVTPKDEGLRDLPRTRVDSPFEGPTRERARIMAQGWRDVARALPCFYDPADVHFVTFEPHGRSTDDVIILLMGALLGLLLLRRLVRTLFGDGSGDPLAAPPLSLKRRTRLSIARQWLPDPWPEGWSRPLSPPGRVVWEIRAGEVTIVAWARAEQRGFWFQVALAARNPGERVSDEQAAAILARFRGVGDFAEVADLPSVIAEAYPGARAWIALPPDVVSQMLPPPKIPAIREQPLNPHLAAVRKHLPEKLPFGWSVPLAVTEVHDGWDRGGWLIDDDDACIIVMLTTSRGRERLAVMIHHPDERPVDEARAMDVLKHFRGVTEFVQTEIGDGGQPGARMYLGELQATGERALLN